MYGIRINYVCLFKWIIFLISINCLGSRPDVGSSRIITSGLCIKAWDIPTLCWNPFERFFIFLCLLGWYNKSTFLVSKNHMILRQLSGPLDLSGTNRSDITSLFWLAISVKIIQCNNLLSFQPLLINPLVNPPPIEQQGGY